MRLPRRLWLLAMTLCLVFRRFCAMLNAAGHVIIPAVRGDLGFGEGDKGLAFEFANFAVARFEGEQVITELGGPLEVAGRISRRIRGCRQRRVQCGAW